MNIKMNFHKSKNLLFGFITSKFFINLKAKQEFSISLN
jgi:hypothetical protein